MTYYDAAAMEEKQEECREFHDRVVKMEQNIEVIKCPLCDAVGKLARCNNDSLWIWEAKCHEDGCPLSCELYHSTQRAECYACGARPKLQEIIDVNAE